MNELQFSERAMACAEKLWRISYLILRNPADCDDAVQEALIRAWTRLGTLRSEEYFETWLVRILVNVSRDLLRKRRPVVELDESMAEPEPPDTALRDAICTLEIKYRLIPCHLKDVAKQANTFIDGDRRRLTLKYINDHQQIVIIKDGSEQYSPDIQDMMNKIKDNAILLEIEPQGMTFGIDLFTPDERFANNIGLFPKDNLKLMITR